ncbi:uncharacterized protein TNCV_5019081 [Trichonephila clavipes]|nr:uncharacterized protein TNCV_5019081 [Trichonephila clavipes]
MRAIGDKLRIFEPRSSDKTEIKNYHTHLEEEYANYRKPPEAWIVRPNDESLEVYEELGIAQSVISRLWQRFEDDGNVSRCYIKGRPRVRTPNEERYIWQLLPKETVGAQHQTCLVSSLQLPVRQFQGRPCTDA